jgi:hypothetical protein
MKIITVDGKEWTVKKLNSESISFDFGTTAINLPDFVGSQIRQNSISSDKYSLSFAIHRTEFQKFKASIKKLVLSEALAVVHPIYGKLTHLIIEHETWGAVKGSILGEIQCNTTNLADMPCNCVFQEHTEENPIAKKDMKIENADAFKSIDAQTSFDVNLSTQDLTGIKGFANSLNNLYNNILDSSVIQAFNDFNAAVNATIVNSLRIMSTTKKILELPNKLLSLNLTTRLNLLRQQAQAIKNTPVTSYNMALYNINNFAYTSGVTSQTVFVSDAALQAAAGIKTVPI